MNEAVRAVLAIFFTLAIILLVLLARGVPDHGTTTQSASSSAVVSLT